MHDHEEERSRKFKVDPSTKGTIEEENKGIRRSMEEVTGTRAEEEIRA